MNIQIIFLSLLCFINTYIKFDLKIEEETSSQSYIENIIKNQIRIIMLIGTPIQKIPVYIKFDEKISYISGTKISNHLYDEKKSNTYKKDEEEKSYYGQTPFNLGIPSSDIFKFETKNKKNEEINLKFILATQESKSKEINTGVLGLKIDTFNYEKNGYFLYQLKSNGISDSYGWTIKLNDNNKEGEIILGEYPHEYDSRNYHEKYYKSTRCGKDGVDLNWNIVFDKFTFDNQIYENEVQGTLNIEFGVIVGITSFRSEIDEKFFKNYIDKEKCSYQRTQINNYYYYTCDTNVDIDEFPSIKFYNKDFGSDFELNYKDLFVKKNDKYYFLIVFESQNVFKWTLGRPFMKKFQMVFDHDRRLIGIYLGKEGFINWTIVAIFVLGLVIIGLLYYIINYFKNRPKRIKANELLEDLEYLTK